MFEPRLMFETHLESRGSNSINLASELLDRVNKHIFLISVTLILIVIFT